MAACGAPPGKWHPFMHLVASRAADRLLAYLGVAESRARSRSAMAKKRKDDPTPPYLVGEMDNLLTTAQIVHASMVELAATAKPGPETSSGMITAPRRSSPGAPGHGRQGAGGRGRRGVLPIAHLERLFRDVQAGRYHPLPDKARERLTGRVLLGLDIDG